MSEKKVTVLLCDLPHKREVRAVDTLVVRSALGGKEKSLDVCTVHQGMVLGNGAKSTSKAPDVSVERLDRVPAGWIDVKKAAEMLEVSAARALQMRKDGHLKARSILVPGRRGRSIFIFERTQVKALAKERS